MQPWENLDVFCQCMRSTIRIIVCACLCVCVCVCVHLIFLCRKQPVYSFMGATTPAMGMNPIFFFFNFDGENSGFWTFLGRGEIELINILSSVNLHPPSYGTLQCQRCESLSAFFGVRGVKVLELQLWPDYRKYLSPEILYIPYKWFAPQTPLKKIGKIPKKIPSKGHPRARTLVEFEEKFPDQFFTICK